MKLFKVCLLLAFFLFTLMISNFITFISDPKKNFCDWFIYYSISALNFLVLETKKKKNYECTKCGKCYSYYSGLYNHRRFECGKDPQFQCPYCPYKAKMKNNLKTHVLCKHVNENNGTFLLPTQK